MTDANLFQLGIGLETGAQEEDTARSATTAIVNSLVDSDREDHFIRRDGKVFAGTHLIIEVMNGSGLDCETRIQNAFRKCVDVCGATLLHIHTHKFSPQGVSGVAVLAESHISVHTWPEIGYGAFDVFMCGDAEPWKAVDVLKEAFDTPTVEVRELLRGEEFLAKGIPSKEVAA
ncbi:MULTISPECIES: adenosylmethionine decarboxylase [Phaeobacter]|uniref:S-adenosylmethionine decarboxylase proenzyme n=1 Tax=Phaeobacter piscinae TaxID=1580596 RepID=A0AAN1GQJ4_9RHOB|nr:MULTISPECIES: adenosylmethionine decarboxylase [Phaeobacter]ATG35526.1 S-adenosylmethionine decarboxylase SpeH [Phaeobacter piscinae]ATG43294.1 S-adenosylmethionine decarboxylase SpeH [Phaeobacter piscinae]AUQ86046.1 S-adenosylmethionine decarboxylase SpeH [Phaeobacter piscinae]AUR23930.1 S-adenosylmethionine decarboxylase SpeH [Phaeobacter piscinae]AUR35612.1 S-adenosylmethionine decarboxylase SpeH [Phaeobacter piscinae]